MNYNRSSGKRVILNTEWGFTMLEMLFAFAIFCVIVFLFPMIVQLIFQHGNDTRMQHLEWEVFVSQIKKEVRIADDLYVVNNVFVLRREGTLVTYERYGDKLRRRVDQQGHEVLLQNVKTATFEPLINGVKLTVTDHRDRLYEANFRSFIDLQKEGGESFGSQ